MPQRERESRVRSSIIVQTLAAQSRVRARQDRAGLVEYERKSTTTSIKLRMFI